MILTKNSNIYRAQKKVTSNRLKQCRIELANVNVSDTTGDDSSTNAGKITAFWNRLIVKFARSFPYLCAKIFTHESARIPGERIIEKI